MKRVAILAALVTATSSPNASPKVRVTPLFWKGQEKPAFAVQCDNESGTSRSRLDYVFSSAAIRLDGELHERKAFVGSMLGPSEVAAGDAFTQVVVLGHNSALPWQLGRSLGAFTILPWDLPLELGEHTVSFTCWSSWSRRGLPLGW